MNRGEALLLKPPERVESHRLRIEPAIHIVSQRPISEQHVRHPFVVQTVLRAKLLRQERPVTDVYIL